MQILTLPSNYSSSIEGLLERSDSIRDIYNIITMYDTNWVISWALSRVDVISNKYWIY